MYFFVLILIFFAALTCLPMFQIGNISWGNGIWESILLALLVSTCPVLRYWGRRTTGENTAHWNKLLQICSQVQTDTIFVILIIKFWLRQCYLILLIYHHLKYANSNWCCHITPILKDLHWLPVKFRYQYKILLLIYKICVHGEGPAYLASMLEKYHPIRTLHSSSKTRLREHRVINVWQKSLLCGGSKAVERTSIPY